MLVRSGGSDAVIWGVVFVKGIPLRMKVIMPPPPSRCLSCGILCRRYYFCQIFTEARGGVVKVNVFITPSHAFTTILRRKKVNT